jgi:ParB family chromosome partitioning protein
MAIKMAGGRLGKGLDAFFGDGSESENALLELRISEIEPCRNQPRKAFDAEKIEALAKSIGEVGVLSPILVKRLPTGFYRIVAGERRWRAAKLAGLKTVPAIVKEFGEEESMQAALIENLQREDLNAMEIARGYQEFIGAFDLTQEELAEKMGVSRPNVANMLRLLRLPEPIADALVTGDISMGHARALLSAEDEALQTRAVGEIVKNGLSVRQTEALMKALAEEEKAENPPKKETEKETPRERELKRYLAVLEKDLALRMGSKVKITNNKHKGKIEIEYYNQEDLERIVQLLQHK